MNSFTDENTIAQKSSRPGFNKNERKEKDIKLNKQSWKNVRLEVGFEYDEEGEVCNTKTQLFYIESENGIITKIEENKPEASAVDVMGKLMLPPFKDMHIHLDKTNYTEPWKAAKKRNGGVREMIKLEQKNMPAILENSTYKAEKIIELLQSHGVAFARNHFNIEPTSGFKSLENLNKALENKKGMFFTETVAFPQHGIFYTPTASLMKEVAQMDIDFIGGLDPHSLDGSIEKTMDFIFQLALDYNKGVDIHLHDMDEFGLKTVEYITQKVNENPQLKGKTYISHAYVLANLNNTQLRDLSDKLAEAQVGIVSTLPIGSIRMPIPALYEHKVKVRTGNDSIIDHWDTFGTGSILQKANLMAQMYGYRTEFELSRCLRIATTDVLPLNNKGQRAWPKIGDPADWVVVDAFCSAEAVSRLSAVKSLVSKGKMLF
ncbi:deaminase [Apibacter muscae]|uniref:Deaminase n=1 Tax=Apibacter muscae TaxID=2509004 RepID=A0A563DCB2_9FLAO|nr:amidohydrolase [Apibacter muscae]TWP27709.1 deaminase [Apibacter muscae]